MFKRTILGLLFLGLMAGALWAADNPFVGDWKLNPAKSKLTDTMKVASAGENKYAFDFGGGNPETIVVDGIDQSGMSGTTLAVTAQGPDAWKVVRKKDGRTLITANWTLSQDGNTITDDFTAISPEGAPSNVKYSYKRTTAGSGFAGTWVSTSEAVNFDFVLQIRPYEGDGLSIVDSTDGLTRNMKLDGKEYPNTGANAAFLTASSLRKLDEHTLELTDKKSNGKVSGTQEVKLSSDLKTLTMTPHTSGGNASQVFVFERQ